MTEQENREAFEREYSNRFPHDKCTLLKSGKYSGWVKQASWEIWNSSSQRQGFKFMPIEPSEEMLKSADNCGIDGKITANIIYKAMIDAV